MSGPSQRIVIKCKRGEPHL